jgi:serine protease
MKSVQPNAGSAYIKPWLTMASNVRPHPANGYCNVHAQECGHGLLDAQKALQAAVDAVPAVAVSASTRVVPPGGTIVFTGSVTPYTNRSIPNAPVWSTTAGTLNSTTGNAVTLIAPTTGSATVTLTAIDSAGKTAFDAVTVRVNRPPVLDPITNQTGTVGQTVAFTVTATDPDNDPLRFAASTLPADALFSPSGQFTWNTARVAAGTYSLVYTASDPFGSTAPATVTITLAPGTGGAPAPTGGGGGGALPLGQLLLLGSLLLAARIRRRE